MKAGKPYIVLFGALCLPISCLPPSMRYAYYICSANFEVDGLSPNLDGVTSLNLLSYGGLYFFFICMSAVL